MANKLTMKKRKTKGVDLFIAVQVQDCNVPGYLEKEIRREKARNGKNRVEERDGEWSSEEMFLDSVIRRPHGSTLTGIYTAPVTGRPGGPSVRRPTARYNLCVATAHGQIQLTRPE